MQRCDCWDTHTRCSSVEESAFYDFASALTMAKADFFEIFLINFDNEEWLKQEDEEYRTFSEYDNEATYFSWSADLIHQRADACDVPHTKIIRARDFL